MDSKDDWDLTLAAINKIRELYRRKGYVYKLPDHGGKPSLPSNDDSVKQNITRIRKETKTPLLVDKQNGKVYGIPYTPRKELPSERKEKIRARNERIIRKYVKATRNVIKLAKVLYLWSKETDSGGPGNDGPKKGS